MTVVLTGSDLTIDELVDVARCGAGVELAPAALERMLATRSLIDDVLERGDEVYGLTTGVGVRKRFRVDPEQSPEFNRRMVLDHRIGQGPYAPVDVVRATMLRLANSFATGTPGVRPELAERVLEALNSGRSPAVRMLGSLGQADLAPMADLAFGLIDGLELAAKEGIALLNSGAFSTALSALALADTLRLADALDVAAALDLEAFGANLSILHRRVGELRPHPGLVATLARLRELLAGSSLWQGGAARNLQDPLVYRCAPQVHGALRDALSFAREQTAIELNASQDNPVPIHGDRRFVSVANFDILPLAAAMDIARIGLAPALTSACERAVKLLQAPLTGLPEGLAARAGMASSALSEFAIAAEAITAEARLLAQPVSYELVSTSGAEGVEDRMTMAPLAARRLAEMASLGERLVAIELVLAAQAVDLRGGQLGEGTKRAYVLLRELVPFTGEDDAIPQDLEPVVELVRSGAIC
jgi:histidine ammonia-lyase